MSTFPDLFKRLLHERFPSQRAFAIHAEGEDRAQAAQAFISQILKGKRPPPLHRLDAWADTLGLKGPERERFMDLACIEHLPEQARPRFRAILTRLEAVEKRLGLREGE